MSVFERDQKSQIQNKVTRRPWLVFLKMISDKNEMSVCGGSILNEKIVLTAAHCICNAMSCKVRTKIHSFLKQCLRNLHFFKRRYFSRNLSINCSIQVPCFVKLKIVHNTALKINGIYSYLVWLKILPYLSA